ncbi:MAG: HAD-IC family P-type ATPase [Lachnospiraceae bacterium]
MRDYKGLTNAEVAQRVSQGRINVTKKNNQKSLGQIIKSHTITYFNILNYIFALMIILTGQIKNVLFIGTVICNSVIGIFQELKVKQLIDKLSVITASKANVYRNGSLVNIPIERIVVDDLIHLSVGEQIATDGVIIESDGLEVNESMLTGESVPVKKSAGDKILSGSFVVAGTGVQKVGRVGNATYVSNLIQKAQTKKRATSEMQNVINRIIKVISIIIIPLGLMFLRSQYISNGRDLGTAVVRTVSGLIGMIPEGLVLLTSVSFILGVGRLAKKKALVQEMEAIEALARVNIVCTDKTGTITTGNLEVKEVIPCGDYSVDDIGKIMGEINGAFSDSNATQEALNARFGSKDGWKVSQKIPFSSSRKYRAVSFEGRGSYALGASENLLRGDRRLNEMVEGYSSKGFRVLLLGKCSEISEADGSVSGVVPAAVIVISDIIKEDARATFEYFAENNVQIKVLSGDNPVTVSTIAKQAGVEGAEDYVDASTLPDDPDELQNIIGKYNIFGRVKPEQKQMFVRAWQKQGNTVAMVGDGVNDVLAIKDADCGIAMASGSDAAKQSAHIVLMDSDFSSMKRIVKEGRLIISNIERVSSLYLTKTIYSMLLVFIFMLIKQEYPFTTLQMGLINVIGIGMPSFLITLEKKDKLSTEGFLYHVLKVALPSALTMVTTILFIRALGWLFSWSPEITSTFVLTMGGMISLLIILEICMPLNTYHKIVFGLSVAVFAFALLFLPGFYDIHSLFMWWTLLMIPILFIVLVLVYLYSRLCRRIVAWWKIKRKSFTRKGR